MNNPRLVRIGRHILLGLAAVAAFALIFGWVVMVTWNAFAPDLFQLPVLGYWQSVAMLVLVRILTGRFTHGHHRRRYGAKTPSGDSAALYSAWWDSEGEAAFQAYVERHLGGGR